MADLIIDVYHGSNRKCLAIGNHRISVGKAYGFLKKVESYRCDAKDILSCIGNVNRWIPCNERFPEPNQTVLYVWQSKNGNVSVLHGWHFVNRVENAWHQSGIGMSRPNEEVTHWMPLPEPPESKVQEDADM